MTINKGSSRFSTSWAVKLAVTVSVLGPAGCVSHSAVDYRPVVDTTATVAYEADLAECKELAFNQTQQDAEHEQRVAIAAIVVGALVGAAIGADIGATSAALTGAAIGGAVGASSAEAELEHDMAHKQIHVIRGCMEGRGYRVLD